MAILFTALANNRGLVDLNLQSQPINDENWSVLCQSLQAHPTLTILEPGQFRCYGATLSPLKMLMLSDEKATRSRPSVYRWVE
jgi:hypothetical protein